MAKPDTDFNVIARARRLRRRLDGLLRGTRLKAARPAAIGELRRICSAVALHAPPVEAPKLTSELRFRIKGPGKAEARALSHYFRAIRRPLEPDDISDFRELKGTCSVLAALGVKITVASISRLVGSSPSAWLLAEVANARGVTVARLRRVVYRRDAFEHDLA